MQFKNSGYTLIGMALILVAIGFLIGMMAAGRHFVHAASLRATLGQLAKYDSAVGSFRAKHDAMPGDLRTPDSHGLSGLPGNGNRLLSDSTARMVNMDGELTIFWRHLSEAKLIDGAYAGKQTGAEIGIDFPRAKIEPAGIGVYSAAGYNYYQIGALSSIPSSPLALYSDSALTAAEAHHIDEKADDGSPILGHIVARGGTVPNGPPDKTPGTGCVVETEGDGDAYAIRHPEPSCQLRIAMRP